MAGGPAAARKGSTYERELVNRFDAAGWGSLRLPSSGSATERDLPDILVGRPQIRTEHTLAGESVRQITTEAWAIELKSGKATTLYVDAQEVADLKAFAETWGARPLLAARSTQQATSTAHYLIEPADARLTDGGQYGLPVAELAQRAYAVVDDEGARRV